MVTTLIENPVNDNNIVKLKGVFISIYNLFSFIFIYISTIYRVYLPMATRIMYE